MIPQLDGQLGSPPTPPPLTLTYTAPEFDDLHESDDLLAPKAPSPPTPPPLALTYTAPILTPDTLRNRLEPP